jgi:cytidine deaminase
MRKLPKWQLDLLKKAKEASKKARCPLSKFVVGAALLASSGKIYCGCNVEFDNYSNTLHAEEVAIGAFVTAGEKTAKAIAIYTPALFPSCGMCRQSLYEIGGPELLVLASGKNKKKSWRLKALLPEAFSLSKRPSDMLPRLKSGALH